MEKLLSIITICKNSEDFIEDTLKSVLEQLDDDMEYLIQDGASTDGTLKIIHQYMEQYSQKDIKLVSESDINGQDAYNKAIKRSSGKWITLCNADDFFVENALVYAKKLLKENDNYDIVACATRKFAEIDGHIYNQILIQNSTSTLGFGIYMVGSFFKKSLFDKVGLFDLSYRLAGDFQMFIRMFANGASMKISNKIIYNFRFGGVSTAVHYGTEIIRLYNLRKHYKLKQPSLINVLLNYNHWFFKLYIFRNFIYKSRPDLYYLNVEGMVRLSDWSAKNLGLLK